MNRTSHRAVSNNSDGRRQGATRVAAIERVGQPLADNLRHGKLSVLLLANAFGEERLMCLGKRREGQDLGARARKARDAPEPPADGVVSRAPERRFQASQQNLELIRLGPGLQPVL